MLFATYPTLDVFMATTLTAPHPLPSQITIPVIFLAGSIEMDKAENWQKRLANSLQESNALLLNPRRESWDSSWTQSIDNIQFREQVEWELNGLDRADIIVVYFDPSTKSPITLLEVGLHAQSGKMLLCCPDGFWRKGNIEIVCDRYDIPLLNDFSGLIDALKERLNNE
jgi:hypothetical protein